MIPKLSVCIPAYEMHGQGVYLLNLLLNSIYSQTFKDLEVVVSDHSVNNDIESFCHNYGKVVYIRNHNKRGSSSANINCAIQHSKGEFIKPMFQDDFLKTNDTLAKMFSMIAQANWVVCGSDQYDTDPAQVIRPRSPSYPDSLDSLALGNNYFSAPSCCLYRRCDIYFDENLIWLMDCDFYRRLILHYGNPVLMNDVLITIKYGSTNVTNTLATETLRQKEYEYMLRKIHRV